MKKNKKAPTFVNTQILILIIYRVYLAFHTYFILQHLQVDIDSGINLPLCYYFKYSFNGQSVFFNPLAMLFAFMCAPFKEVCV